MLAMHRPIVDELEAVSENCRRFSIGPLEPGFGHTIGNSLRRTMLSAIPGAAVTQVRFDRAQHEFTTIAGVAEDVTDIILNLKDLVLNVFSEDPVTLRLDVRGEADVTAADIHEHGDVEILNPSMPIATLNGAGRLSLDITVARGRGYRSADDNKELSDAIGVIPVDSIYSPVRRVAFQVEAMRVEQSTDYDRLVMEVETDGSVSPKDALTSAAATLGKLIGLVEDLSDDARGLELTDHTIISSTPAEGDLSIDDLDLTMRPRNCLNRAGILTLNQLLEQTREDLLQINNFGDQSLEEVEAMLDERGLKLRGGE